ncbi:hypothetical protein DM15PD_00560 [Aristophania vespae]|nr:hypothetical protein DM15PD_00560 [Aristophania vespae]
MSALTEAEFKALTDTLLQKTEQAQKCHDEVKAEIKNFGKISDETTSKVDKALCELHKVTEEQKSMSLRLSDMEQKGSKGIFSSGNLSSLQSAGEQFINAANIKSTLNDSWSGKLSYSLERKTLMTTSGSGTSGTTPLVQADRVPGIIPLPTRKPTIRDLLMPGTTNSSAVDYTKETGFQNKADFVAENPDKPFPKTLLEVALSNVTVRDIAHSIDVTRQALADSSLLRSYIDGRLLLGLALKEDDALLNGDGTGISIKGLIANSVSYSRPNGATVTNETSIDRLRFAMLQAAVAEYPSTGIILNRIDWANICLTKDKNGRYIFTNPTAAGIPTLWGLPVVETMAMTPGKFLTGGLSYSAQIFDRQMALIEVSTENNDNFEKGLVTIRATERLALAVYRPESLIYGSFGDTGTAPATPDKESK